MALRPARCYRDWDRPWSRTAKRKVNAAYVKGAPDPRIRSFDMGKLPENKAVVRIDMGVDLKCQIRDNALEAARISANKYLEKALGIENYHFKVRKFPHHVLREHAILSGAGADRLSQGMRHGFGKPKGRAIRVKVGEPILSVWVANPAHVKVAKEALRRASAKFPGSPIYKVEELQPGTAA